MCTAATYILIRILAYLRKDPEVYREVVSEETEARVEEAVEALLFKPGYTSSGKEELWRGGLMRQEPAKDS